MNISEAKSACHHACLRHYPRSLSASQEVELKDRCQSGLMSTPGKRVYPNPVPRVRIPPCPPASFFVGPHPLVARVATPQSRSGRSGKAFQDGAGCVDWRFSNPPISHKMSLEAGDIRSQRGFRSLGGQPVVAKEDRRCIGAAVLDGSEQFRMNPQGIHHTARALSITHVALPTASLVPFAAR